MQLRPAALLSHADWFVPSQLKQSADSQKLYEEPGFHVQFLPGIFADSHELWSQ
jgi:hypothetical protein